MKVIVLGGDGFCGWPAALHLSAKGHDVTIVDNLSRRNIDNELEAYSLTPIATMGQRLAKWKELAEREIRYEYLDVAKEYDRLAALFQEIAPDAVVHFAEQRAAPYSMKGVRQKRYTVENNLGATHNVLCAIVESGLDIHLVHLGTMGVYGYDTTGGRIPEGYLTVHVPNGEGDNEEREILFPPDPGSVYHMTKTQDQLFFKFYNKNDGVRITDLHQGIVWGTNTRETAMDEVLVNRFDYDGDYGTVLNRFLMQAACEYPLTVHGTGGQTRAFIHLQDSVRCIELAVTSPPPSGERVRILNQVTETHQVRELASMISELTGARINYMQNPRKEAAENTLDVANEGLIDLGLEPTFLRGGLMLEVHEVAERYKDRCDLSKIPCTSYWTESNAPKDDGEAVEPPRKLSA